MKKVLGLILELNPYHNGHKYFIEKAKEIIKPDITIAIISSSFTMRGDPMVMDKFNKTKLLLEENIDLVVELPFISCVNNSDYFCDNSVKILQSFNVTDICFGCEANSLSELEKMVQYTTSIEFNNLIKKYINLGFSYSTSSTKALLELTNDSTFVTNYCLPNNTLGIGYLKSIKQTNIKPHIIKRIDNNYYDEITVLDKMNSATAIRLDINNNKDVSQFIPNYEYKFYKPTTLENNLYNLLQYNFINNDHLHLIKGVNEGIENRLNSFINELDYNSFINKVITKRYTINKIKRLILYILLDINKQYENKSCFYLRVLGMNEIGKKHLNTLNKNIKKDIITSFKNINNDLVNIEIKATKLYSLITNNYDLVKEEYNIPYRKEIKNDNI